MGTGFLEVNIQPYGGWEGGAAPRLCGVCVWAGGGGGGMKHRRRGSRIPPCHKYTVKATTRQCTALPCCTAAQTSPVRNVAWSSPHEAALECLVWAAWVRSYPRRRGRGKKQRMFSSRKAPMAQAKRSSLFRCSGVLQSSSVADLFTHRLGRASGRGQLHIISPSGPEGGLSAH